MVAEEERMAEQDAQTDAQASRSAAEQEFEQLVEKQKLARLHQLLEKSSKYTDFLYERMRAQQVPIFFARCSCGKSVFCSPFLILPSLLRGH